MNVLITHMVFWNFEDYSFAKSLYGALATVTTVGYGDVSFTRTGTRIFASFWLLISPLNTLYSIQGLVAVVSGNVEEDDDDDDDDKGAAQKGGLKGRLSDTNLMSAVTASPAAPVLVNECIR
eukprot:1186780-Prorocentrum_minimum.AAC.1